MVFLIFIKLLFLVFKINEVRCIIYVKNYKVYLYGHIIFFNYYIIGIMFIYFNFFEIETGLKSVFRK